LFIAELADKPFLLRLVENRRSYRKLSFIPPKPPMSRWRIISGAIRIHNMSFNGIEELGPYHINTANDYPIRQISEHEVEIETQFPLDIRDIVFIDDIEYMCVRVRYDQGHPYRITLRTREEVINVDMRKALEHTRMRFDTMTERKLWNRMGATTDMNKLIAFAQVADERGMSAIAAAARARFEELYHRGYPIDRLSYTTEDNNKPVKDINERLLRKIDI